MSWQLSRGQQRQGVLHRGCAMKSREDVQQGSRISDAAVQAKTGKAWDEWFAILDAAGARDMTHPEIARYLQEVRGVPDWWCQMVANTYEQHSGARQKHQMPQGYQISVSRTIQVPLPDLYLAWSDEGVRGSWLQDAITVRNATPHKSMRVTWGAGQTSVEVLFYQRGEAKSQVVVQHSKLGSPREAEEKKLYWREALDRLSDALSKPKRHGAGERG